MENERGALAREVLAVRFGQRVTTRTESFLNFPLYGEPDAELGIDYYYWVIRDPRAGVVLVDTGFDPGVGDRRRRVHWSTPASGLSELGVTPDDVTAVVVTHAHWDHTGNVGQFPNAQIIMTAAEYAFWTSPLAARLHFASASEPADIALLRRAREADRLTVFTGQYTLAPGIELIETGGHTPGQLIAMVATAPGSGPATPASPGALTSPGAPASPGALAGPGSRASTVVLASDALHFYEEVERDRPFAIVADLAAMYRAYDTLAELASQPGTYLVAGHDPEVRRRFAAHPAGADVTDLSRPLASAE